MKVYENRYEPTKVSSRLGRSHLDVDGLVALVRRGQIRSEYEHILSTKGRFEELYEITTNQEPALK